MVAAEFADPATGLPDPARVAAIQRHCLEEGHLILMNAGTYGNVIRWMPPLIVSEAEIDRGLETFALALKETRRP
jgi:4-aminobutyrate aminotransferase-like enzyme